MGWNLPPGVTDKDIDDAAPGGSAETYQCDCCLKMFPRDELLFIRHNHPNSNAPCDTAVCHKCCGDEEE